MRNVGRGLRQLLRQLLRLRAVVVEVRVDFVRAGAVRLPSTKSADGFIAAVSRAAVS